MGRCTLCCVVSDKTWALDSTEKGLLEEVALVVAANEPKRLGLAANRLVEVMTGFRVDDGKVEKGGFAAAPWLGAEVDLRVCGVRVCVETVWGFGVPTPGRNTAGIARAGRAVVVRTRVKMRLFIIARGWVRN